MDINLKMLNQRNCNVLTFALFLCIITSASIGATWFIDNFNRTHVRNFETELKSFNFNIKVSATYNDIIIDDIPGSLNNWSWAALQAWCSGSGTSIDPYIIESHTLSILDSGDGIQISNSHGKYFIIKNNMFQWDGGFPIGTIRGISLSNTTNGQILNNTVHDLTQGIYAYQSEDIVITNNTIYNVMPAIYLLETNFSYISENTAFDSEIGIYLSFSNENIINRNTVYNTSNGLQIYDSNENTINRNTVYVNLNGLQLSNSKYNDVFENTAYNNDEGISLLSSENNSFYDNNLSYNFDFGMSMSNSHNNSISENVINDNTQDGIKMSSSDDNEISENSVQDNGIDGIFLYQSDYNTFFKNYISNNVDEGIELSDGDAKSDYNLMYYNFFIGNNINAIDRATNIGNNWNNSFIGNYWNNYTGTDVDNDGIGDIAHSFDGGIDYLPIWDISSPIISIITPTEGEVFGGTAPSFTIEINEPYLDAMWYSLDGGFTNIFFIINGSINQSVWDLLPQGVVNITFSANDIFGQIGSTSVLITKRIQTEGDGSVFLITGIIISVVGSVAIIAAASIIYLKKRRTP